MANINPTLAATPSGPAYVAARTAYEAAITQHGANSEQAKRTGGIAMKAAMQCARELGNNIPI